MKTNYSKDEDLLLKNMPSRDWARKWLKNIPKEIGIKSLPSEEMEIARINNCTPDILTSWWTNIYNGGYTKKY